MDFDKLQQYKIVNLSRQLRTPTLIRVDINLPASHGRIEEDALRMRVYAHVLELYSDYTGLVVMSHQGRKGDDDFTSLAAHARMLRKHLPRDVEVDFVSHESVFTEETRSKIRRLGKRQVMVLDNMRYFEEEKKWVPETDTYVPFFKGVIGSCVNDSIPTWHRTDSSLMCLPHVAPTLVGLRSSYEMRILKEVVTSKEPKALVMGGAKLQKVSDLLKIAATGVEIFTGGLPGQLVARARGCDLGEANNAFLDQKFTGEDFVEARKLDSLRDGRSGMAVHHPLDFIVEEGGERRNVKIDDLPKSKGVIKDIGEETLEGYATRMQEKPIRIRAGPLGVYEESYQNGLELTKRIGGDGLIFLGGDTSQELNEGGLLGHVEDSGGRICVSGGSFLHGWAGGSFPSVDELLMQSPLLLEHLS
ncbi:MAG: phosphoglycerate kinase [Thaumarchaeota archaeon]|nr:phosphoglycerate kinase [Nitrososphaerota archaeon]